MLKFPTDEELAREAAQEAKDETRAVLDAKGITVKKLACLLKKELLAKETKLVKIKGGVPTLSGDDAAPKKRTRRNFKTLLAGGIDQDGLIAVDVVAWGVRQNARMDAQKLLNLYPAKKIEVAGKDGGAIPVQMTNFPPAPATIDEWQRQVEEAEKQRLQRESGTKEDTGAIEIVESGASSQADSQPGGQ
jgi:hypothetical protein